jgi:bis(5'-nucleosidyl)-tetraphosphatase
MPREKSAGAIIYRKEKGNVYYLLLHYKSGHWDFPKGHIEEGEKEEDTVRREVEEETGIKDLKIMLGFKEWIKYMFRKSYNLEDKKKAPWIFKIVIFYLAEANTEEVKISYEHVGFKWLLYDEAMEQLTYKNAKEVLKKANDFLENQKTSL